MRKILIPSMAAMLLAGCAGSVSQPQTPATSKPLNRPASAAPAHSNYDAKGLEAVMGKDSATLSRMFGTPRLDVQEANGRKLQFSGAPCVLDTYLYPDGKNGAEIVTYVDARRSDGAEVDRAACVNALLRR